MAINTKFAKETLTKKEQLHLSDCNIKSTRDMKEQIKYMKKLNPEHPNKLCFDCWSIAIKLNLTN